MGSARINYTGTGVAVGGLFGLVGAFMHWFKFDYANAAVRISGGLAGTEDWTGRVAAVAGCAALLGGAAYVLLTDPAVRRLVGPLMGAASAFLLVMSVMGAVRLNDAVSGTGLAGGFSASWGPGLALSFVGGVVAFVASMLSIGEWKQEAPAVPTEAVEDQPEHQSV